MFNKENKKTMAENSVAGSNRIVGETKIEGTIQTVGRLVVGKTGIVSGKVICTNADVEGAIRGTLFVKNTLSLKSTAIIEGEVQAEKLAIEPGAIFNVKCSMGGNISKETPINEPQRKEEKSK